MIELCAVNVHKCIYPGRGEPQSRLPRGTGGEAGLQHHHGKVGGRRPKRVEVLGDFFQRMLFTETIVGEALDAHEGSPTYRADVRVRGVTVVTARVPRSETRATLRKSLFFPGNREIFLKNRDAIERQPGQSLREIRDLDDFCEGKITEKKQGGNRGGSRFPGSFFWNPAAQTAR
jgi:hypothetical protein